MASGSDSNKFRQIRKAASLSKLLFSALLLLPAAALAQNGVRMPIRPGIVFPVLSPKLSSGYGNRVHPVYHYKRHHSGIDLAVPEKTHVRAVLEGRVVFAGVYAGFGKLVTIEHSHGDISMYGHLSEIKVNVGQQIKQGEILGRVGSTGISTGPHLHFEWRHQGETIDPLKVFPYLTSVAEG